MDMVFPFIGTILYYIIIFTGANFRSIISEWGASFLGGDLILTIVAYLFSILVVTLWCNMKIFHMWGLDKYPIHQQKDFKEWKQNVTH